MSPKGTTTGIFSGGAFAEASASGSGDLSVAVTPNSATWTIHGPLDFGTDGVETGTGDATFAGSPAGAYYIQWDALSGYRTPRTGIGFLADGETLTFTGTYVALTTPSGRFNVALLRLRAMVAASSNFQSWVGALSAEDALDSIFLHCEEGESAALAALRPFALIHYGEKWESPMLAGGSKNFHLDEFSLELHFEADTEASLVDAPGDALTDFANQIGPIVDDILDLSGQSGYLAINNLSFTDGPPWRSDERSRHENDFCHVGFVVEFGGGG
jgi:hypothetical protein